MGRRKVIDRDKVLEAAEGVVVRAGAAGLTFEAVAAAAGITKGGVQSCFGSKEALIEAMLRRWGALYDADVERLMGGDASVIGRVRAHVRSTAEADDAVNARAGALVAALLQSPDYLAWVRGWYAERFGALSELEGPEGTSARIAFLATEGLFFLRHFGLMDVSREEWRRQFEEVSAIIPLDGRD
jgi:AcrR family transcriptional regulator